MFTSDDVVQQYRDGVPTDDLVDWNDPLSILIAREEAESLGLATY